MSNEPQLIAGAVLDAIARTFQADCSWLQVLDRNDRGHLEVIASRGLNPEVKRTIETLNVDTGLGKHIIGSGQSLTVPDLNNDGVLTPLTIRESGLRWLIAVPLMVHRALGILAVGGRRKKEFDRDLSKLLEVAGSLVGGVLLKSQLSRPRFQGEQPRPSPRENNKERQTTFQQHVLNMEQFRERHANN